jgi:hypothetical protein
LNPLNPPRALFQTTDELIAFCEVMVWAFVVCIVMLVFGGLVFTMLYSVTFVQQPLKTMAPIDMAYTKMLNDIVLLMTGSITTLIGMRVAKKASEMIANKVSPKLLEYNPSPVVQPTAAPAAQTVPAQQASVVPDWNFMGYQNPELDESWRPGPPPTTAPDHLDPSREEIAQERAAAKGEA